MRQYFRNLLDDIIQTPRWAFALIVVSIFSVYGLGLIYPSVTLDFNSAKGDSISVFLTYFFMHRATAGVIAAMFYDFSPFWNGIAGLIVMVVAALFLRILFRRLDFSDSQAVLGSILWMATPFFFSRSIYQHVMPASPIAFVVDVLVFLLFVQIRRCENVRALNWAFVLMCVGMAVSIGEYQAHAGLLLTGLLGICALRPANNWRRFLHEFLTIVGGLTIGVAMWGIVCHGPMIVAKFCGLQIPKSGGAHDSIYWFVGGHSFGENFASLLTGLAVQWGYNAFFVRGLRFVILAVLLCFLGAIILFSKGRFRSSVTLLAFVGSIFAFPVIQCSAANFRTHFCLIPFVVFAALLLMRWASTKCRSIRVTVLGVIAYSMFVMGHETSTLYYYNWKQRQHDGLHLAVIAHDIWSRYGLHIKKPVAIIGGWKYAPTCWEDLRPFSFLPLLNHPFIVYSQVNCINTPREIYMIMRETVGAVLPMPSLDVYNELKTDQVLLDGPSYPQEGYIFEKDGLIVVNLGKGDHRWRRFRYEEFGSPNEKLMARMIRQNWFERVILQCTGGLRTLASRYAWALQIER